MKVHHVAVVVADLARAEAFYGGVLGLTVERRWADAAGAARSIWFALEDGAFLAVEKAGASGPTRADDAPGWHCVVLAIALAERPVWRARLAVERESAYTLYTRDADGNLVGLSHWPEPCGTPVPS